MTWTVGAGFDPGWRSDGCGGCIVLASPARIFYVACTFERTPSKGRPLVPSIETAAFCELAKRYGAETITTDSFYVESVREHVRAAGLELREAASGAAGKANVYATVRDLLHADRVRIPAKQVTLIRQLREVMTEPLSGGGIRITSPRRAGAHGDVCSAFVLALWRAEHEHALAVDDDDCRVVRCGVSDRGRGSEVPASVRLRWSAPPGERIRRTANGFEFY